MARTRFAHRGTRILVALVAALALLVPSGVAVASRLGVLSISYTGLSISDDSILAGQSVTLSAAVSGGDAKDLRYNFGWRRNGSWDKGSWDSTLNQGGYKTSPTWTFRPPASGTYEVFVDVVRPDGIPVGTKVATLSVARGWSAPSGITLSKSSPQNTGTQVTLSAPATGERSSRVSYRLRWTRDGGEDSHTGSYADSPSLSFTPTHSGDYTLYVDLRDKDTGEVVTLSKSFRANRSWDLTGLDLSYASPLRPGASVTWTAKVSGDTSGLKYNFIWLRDNWAEWGSTLRSGSWSSSNRATYKIGGSGRYTFQVEVEDRYGEREVYTVGGIRGYSASDAANRVISVARSELDPTNTGNKYEDALVAAGGTMCNNRRGWWCVAYLWWCFREADQQDVFGTTGMNADPEYLADEFASQGRYNSAAGLPGVQPGDIVFFYWSPWRSGQKISHGTLVVSVTDSTVTLAEGNTFGGGSQLHTWSRWHPNLRGYAHPAY